MQKEQPSVSPKLVLWDPNFTIKDPFFRVAVHPDASMEEMALFFLGYKLKDSEKGADFLQLTVPGTNDKFCIGTWEKFLENANDEQIREVKQTLRMG